ncbi:hypothetical protein [Amphibacillus xylanus]|uniref:Uncharacterized protein n=1 Tax=Amphibacillus xylanus (strain ATCC 51415 / DSM 6626 / JCM 7361 / LMG 17667 / NBRC 15112 / Ep01) TaxID=698758 RepID=K0J213_AMPXN|nr:hypothetical protein [Amphibacillus xylanus]BAM47142.1 hypothetical protein AXY_10100 [Amphibacillus xylanus NBRC 15112]
MIKWNRTYTLLSILIVLFLILIWYYSQLYLLEPARESIRDSEVTLAEHQVLLDLADLGKLSIESIEREADLIRVNLPTEKNLDQIIVTLQEIERETGVILDLVNLSDSELKTDLDYYPDEISAVRYQIDFTAETFAEFEAFLLALNDQERAVEIDELKVQQTSTEAVSGSVAIRFFYDDGVKIN